MTGSPGDEPAFSPDGHTLAITRGADGCLCLRDLATGKERVVRAHLTGNRWLPGGRQILVKDYVYEAPSDAAFLVVDAATGRVAESFAGPFRGSAVAFSPDGRYADASPRVLEGSTIFDWRSGQRLDVRCSIDGYYPGVLDRWSPDEQRLLWRVRRRTDPGDGNTVGDTIACSSSAGSGTRVIGRGREAHFSPDSLHVMWIEARHWYGSRPGRPLWGPIDGRPRVLATDVDAFDIVS